MIDLRLGDCLEVLKEIPDNSVDSIVTDPPYGLSFMGKKWDYDVPSEDVWRECLRVLKPGGHLLSFAGSRTYHRMAVRIEDAGFEIRDQIMWIYGSGFPKSHDVSKAIDKANGKHERELQPFADYVRERRRSLGWSLRDLDEAMGTNTAASWWEGRKSGIQPPGVQQYRKLKVVIGMDDRFDELIDWLEAEREKVGEKYSGIANREEGARHTIGASKAVLVDITAPATEQAKQWEGWGSALKPAHEPIVLARKPLCGTIAQNVLEHGTGGLNIDGCRVGTSDSYSYPNGAGGCSFTVGGGIDGTRTDTPSMNTNGRFPANIIHDGSDEVVELFPQTSGGKYVAPSARDRNNGIGLGSEDSRSGAFDAPDSYGDQGSAARFFKQVKCDNDLWQDQSPQQSNANIAEHHSFQESKHVVSALDLVVKREVPGGRLSSDTTIHFTTVTANECAIIYESVTQLIRSLDKRFWQEPPPESITRSNSLARVAVTRKQIDTTTITVSLSKSGGYVEAATFNIMHPSTEHGAKDCLRGHKFTYCAKASKRDRDEGLGCSCHNIGTKEWEKQGQKAATRQATELQAKRDTTEFITAADCEWRTSSNGNGTTEQSPTDTKSTTSTKISRTTESKTCDSLIPSHTNGSIAAVSNPQTDGSSDAVCANNLDRSLSATGISQKRDGFSTDDANPVISESSLSGSENASNVSRCPNCGKITRSTHPTVKPTDLMKYLCRLVTPPNGIVLDPFMGSGSTGKGAVLEGFRFIGIEREPEYYEIAKARIEAAAQELKQLEIAI